LLQHHLAAARHQQLAAGDAAGVDVVALQVLAQALQSVDGVSTPANEGSAEFMDASTIDRMRSRRCRARRIVAMCRGDIRQPECHPSGQCSAAYLLGNRR
jgi:hypothetical protein